MSALNLIRAFKKNDELHVTFTKEGKKLWGMKIIPLFNGDLSKVFSEKRRNFYIGKIFFLKEN